MTTNNTIGSFQQPRLVIDALQEFIDDLDRLKPSDDSVKPAIVQTGFSDLDQCISGMRPGSVIVIAARPSMGKSTLALNIASNVALRDKLPVLIFSMDQSTISVISRLVSRIAKIEMKKLRTRKMDEIDQNKLNEVHGIFRDLPILIDETVALTVDEIIAKSLEVISKNSRLGLIVIDYLQLINNLSDEENNDANYEVVMSTLRTLARETNTPVILISQLNRKLEIRSNKRPRITDLPSRFIGQYSDLLMFLYRDECYNPDGEKDVAEIIISRNRYGPFGTILLGATNLKYNEFSNF